MKGPDPAVIAPKWLKMYVAVLVTSCRDPADHTPAPPDRRSPSNCANLPAPGDTWVQLRPTSLVEPVHHVSTDWDVTCYVQFIVSVALKRSCSVFFPLPPPSDLELRTEKFICFFSYFSLPELILFMHIVCSKK